MSTRKSSEVVSCAGTNAGRFFAGLGTVVDFHDTLIIFAYDQQLSADVENTPYYLECLQGIAAGRGSEQLQEKVVIESSLGKVSLLNIRDAYKQLNLDINEHLTEDYIIGMYDSRVPDVGKQQEAELKEALRTIGIHRHSERVKNHASGSMFHLPYTFACHGMFTNLVNSHS
jgi:ubiquitin carboxyl-terminal hydrolase 25/28